MTTSFSQQCFWPAGLWPGRYWLPKRMIRGQPAFYRPCKQGWTLFTQPQLVRYEESLRTSEGRPSEYSHPFEVTWETPRREVIVHGNFWLLLSECVSTYLFTNYQFAFDFVRQNFSYSPSWLQTHSLCGLRLALNSWSSCLSLPPKNLDYTHETWPCPLTSILLDLILNCIYLFIYLLPVCMCVCECGVPMPVDIWRRLEGVGSFLLPCVSWRLNSGFQQALSATESSH